MKVKPVTLALVIAAFLLGIVVYVTQRSPNPAQNSTETTEGQKLFAFEESQVQSLTLQTRERSLSFEQDSNDKWQMIEPDRSAANEASVAFLLNLLATERSDRVLAVPASDRQQFGLDQPLATIEVKLSNQETHRLILGEYDFNRSFIYAQTDPPPEATPEIKVLLVSPNFQNAVDRPFEEWKE